MLSLLVIQTASIGDAILTTPLLEKLHQFYPEARIDVLVKKGNESIFAGHPFIHQTLIWEKQESKYKNLLTLLKQIRSIRYDYVINLQRFASSGLLTVFSKAKHTIGFDKNPFSATFDTTIKHEIGVSGVHEVDRNLKLIESITGPGTLAVRLYPQNSDIEAVSKYKNGDFICIAPASLWFTKQYPESKWIDFINKTQKKYTIYLLGSQNDSDLCERIIRGSDRSDIINLAGKLTLLQTAALMKDAVMNYVNDSAPQHLASGVNAPVTAIFCSTIADFGFGPLSDDAVIIETDKKLSCRPCGLHGFRNCPEKHFDCAMTIRDDQLLSRLP